MKRTSIFFIMLLLTLSSWAQQIKITDIIGVWETVDVRNIHSIFDNWFTIEPDWIEGGEDVAFATSIDGTFYLQSRYDAGEGTFTFDGKSIYAKVKGETVEIPVKFISSDRIIAMFDGGFITFELEMVKTSGAYEGADNGESFFTEADPEKDKGSFPWIPVSVAVVAVTGAAIGIGVANAGSAGAAAGATGAATGAITSPPLPPMPQPVPPVPPQPVPPIPQTTPPPVPQPAPPTPPAPQPAPTPEPPKPSVPQPNPAEEAAKAAEEAAQHEREVYLDSLRDKYGLPEDATIDDIKEHVRTGIKNALKDLDAANAESTKMTILIHSTTAAQVVIDTTMDIAGKAAGPGGRLLAGAYTTAKNFTGECLDAHLNGKSMSEAVKKAGLNSIVDITQSNMGSIGWKATANVVGDAVKGGAGAYIEGKDGYEIAQKTFSGMASGAVKTIIDAKISGVSTTNISNANSIFNKKLDVADELFKSGDITEKTRNALYNLALNHGEAAKAQINLIADSTTGVLQGAVGTYADPAIEMLGETAGKVLL
ncbi:MAG: hypothetical protein KBT33_00670 [Prevotellaceae bacterium]|nr:hypothetical protein [Candidatus Minthosoma equi]